MRIVLFVVLLAFIAPFEQTGIDDKEQRSVSTSIVSMMELLKTEHFLVDTLSDYAEELEQKLSTIKEAILKMRNESEKSKADEEAYLSNPINAFSLVRRMHEDWRYWQKYLINPIGVDQIAKIEAEFSSLPTENELVNAIYSIDRLQTSFDLQLKDMARGFINGKQYDVRLSAFDLFAIGSRLLNDGLYLDAKNWLHEALKAYKNSSTDAVFDFNKKKINSFYTEAKFKQEHFGHLKKMKESNFLDLKASWDNEMPVEKIHELYLQGCRGEFPMRTYSLHCRYNRTAHDFLKLAPLKMEEISLDPYIVLYHDVLTDFEIKHLKSLAAENLMPAKTISDDDKDDYRTAQMSWLDNNETEITYRINNRVNQMTRFDVEISEAFQVVNYGIGGHFYMHTDDYAEDLPDYTKAHGDRIATVNFYMSDVEHGGATVFPIIKVAISPQKGAALMWYNLDSKGDSIFTAHHAGCPVLVGSKWLLTKWIADIHQFRIRPCLKE